MINHKTNPILIVEPWYLGLNALQLYISTKSAIQVKTAHCVYDSYTILDVGFA